MFHVPVGALVVPTSLSDLHHVVATSGLDPIPARHLPLISSRARMGATTVTFGTPTDVAQAIAAWGSNPVIAVGSDCLPVKHTFPSDAPLAFLARDHAPEETRAYVIGDVHNCHRTLRTMLETLNVLPGAPSGLEPLLVFVGDLVDKGGTEDTDVVETIRLVKCLTDAGQAVVVRGNHEQMLVRRYRGISPTAPSSQRSLDMLAAEPDADALVRWLGSLPLAYRLAPVEGMQVTVAHATATELAFMSGTRAQRLAEQSCLFGRRVPSRTNGIVFHGHWEVDAVQCRQSGDTMYVNVDTGACLGNKLSAYDATVLPIPGILPAVCVPTHELDLAQI